MRRCITHVATPAWPPQRARRLETGVAMEFSREDLEPEEVKVDISAGRLLKVRAGEGTAERGHNRAPQMFEE